MCGRIVYDHNEEIRKFLLSKLNIVNYDQISLQPTFNAAPGTFLPIIYEESLVIKADLVEWGFIPTWDKARKTKFANARVETVATKNSFSGAFRDKRCIVPITGYYEWKIEEGTKQPYFIHSKTNSVLTLAGIYDNSSFTILTTAAVGGMKEIHERMPLVLDKDFWDEWLNNKPLSEFQLSQIIAKANKNVIDFTFHKVDRAVNSVLNNRRELLDEVPHGDLPKPQPVVEK